METLRDLEACPTPERGSVVTIGAYDGVHVGHRHVIAGVVERAKAAGLATAVVTFDPHPAYVVRPSSAPRLLTDLATKLELLATTDLDYTLVLNFDEARASESAEDFVKTVLVGCLNAKVVVVGEDFHFGKDRRGNVALLRELGAALGFTVEPVHLVGPDLEPARDEAKVSSTAIRRCLRLGVLREANVQLGRPFEMRGVVVEGDRRGSTIGFPTANVALGPNMCLPADGVYAGLVGRGGASKGGGADITWHRSAINLGRRPTFYENVEVPLLEAHLLDFDGDLYGETLRVRFVERLRDERKFDGIDDLSAQLARDCDDARAVLD